MDETTSFLMKLVAENTRLTAALNNLKTKMKNDMDEHNRVLLNRQELEEVLEIAGMMEIDVIQFGGSEDDEDE